MLVAGLILLAVALASGSSRSGQSETIPGLALQKPKRAPVDKQAEIVPSCEDSQPIGPFRFSRDEPGELGQLMRRLGAGSEPYAVRITGRTIAEMGKGGIANKARRNLRGAVEPIDGYPGPGQWDVFQLGFKPPGTHTLAGNDDRVGYVLSRTRRRYRPGEALVEVEGSASIKELPKVPAAAARLVAAGTVSTSWDVAIWEPVICGYRLYKLTGDPGQDALDRYL